VKPPTDPRPAAISRYLANKGWVHPQSVEFLAAGEYNENYLVIDGASRCVFRINHGSQLALERQIEYEHGVLQCLADTGVTPKPIEVDPDAPFGNGVLLMEYIPGNPFDYTRDMLKAARTFALIHRTPPSPNLISQVDPVADIISESEGMIAMFGDHPLTEQKSALLKYRDRLRMCLSDSASVFETDDTTITNTEVNSGNFIVNGEDAFLVDWEKAVNSYRYQDLGHFLVPTTTLWKTDFLFDEASRHRFLASYKKHSEVGIDIEELGQKTKVMEDVIRLRALSWCYMAYYEYTQLDRALRNQDTLQRIRWYLDEIAWFLR
jgi:aminoglycoside phosphotransferase (APT) family kinase protein